MIFSFSQKFCETSLEVKAEEVYYIKVKFMTKFFNGIYQKKMCHSTGTKAVQIMLVSISSTLYVRFFCTNVVFSCYVLALSKKFVRKIRVLNVYEIFGW